LYDEENPATSFMLDAPTETIENKPKSKRGGARPGSGRKPLLDKAEIDRDPRSHLRAWHWGISGLCEEERAPFLGCSGFSMRKASTGTMCRRSKNNDDLMMG
jgi:hypothetical protein